MVTQIQITAIGSISGGGALVESNAGIIGGCRVADDVTTDAGAIAGTNSGMIYACCHTGVTHGTAGLVGTNSGSIVGCYQAGDVDSGTAYGIAGGGSGQTDCPVPASLYEMQQETFADALNQSLQTLYDAHPDYTRFTFEYSTVNFPIIR